MKRWIVIGCLLLPGWSGATQLYGHDAGDYSNNPNYDPNDQYDGDYPAHKPGFAVDAAAAAAIQNAPDQSNSAYHDDALGGVAPRAGEDLSAVVNGTTRSLRRLGDNERARVGSSSVNTPFFYMRRRDDSGALVSVPTIHDPNGEVELIDPSHPDWPNPTPPNPFNPATADCVLCCAGQSFYANGVCFRCEDPTNPPATSYRCE